MKPCIIPSYCF